MNVLLLSQGYRKNPKEATGITLMLLATYLRKEGCKVAIISDNTDDKEPWKRTVRDGIEILQFKASGKRGHFWAGIDQVLRYVVSARKLRMKPDIIHGFSSAPALASRTAACRLLFLKARTVHTIKSYSRVEGAKYRFVSALRMVDKVTVPTEIMRKELGKRGVKGVEVVRSPVNLERFRPRDRERLKRQYGYAGKKIIFYYGAMFHNKGAHVLAEAMTQVIGKHKDALFLYAPRHGGQEVEAVKDVAKAVGERAVFLEGDVKIEDFVAMADLVVLPYVDISGTEGNPSCLLEAAACRTPVVTTDFPELREIMMEGEDVLMARPGDPSSLSREISRALSDHGLRERLASNAHAKVGGFDSEKIGAEFHNLYKRLRDT